MPGYKGHTIGAAVACAIYVAVLTVLPFAFLTYTSGLLTDWQLVVGLFIVAVLFGLWPDIDTNSKGQDIFYGLAFGADVLLIFAGQFEAAAYFGLLCMMPVLSHHRGWTHSKWAMMLVPSPIVIIPYLYKDDVLPTALLVYGAAVIGFFSHLLLDGKIVRWIHVKGQTGWRG
ncbi:metal-dependent hydrolase [Candidatus Saccharibacteria bacterium]|nr:metal-dependent hydrolase [Candidatus Saccharibacteria bacterium]